MGKHDFLMEKKGKYYELVSTQLVDEKIENISEERGLFVF